MELKTLKALALTSAVALGIAIASPAQAQTETVSAQLITSSAITTVLVSDMDFGEYLIQHGTDTPSLTLSNDGSVTVTTTGTVTDSQIVQITAPATEGVVTVDIPAPATLQMTSSAFTDFGSAALSLGTGTYRTASENGNIISGAAVVGAPGVPVTVVTGAGTPENINFGGIILITGTPLDNTHTAQYDVTLAY